MPFCRACPSDAVCHWGRRPTDAELSALNTVETERRAQITLLADPEQPPAFPSLPTAADTVMAVYACAAHGLTLDLAAHIHAAGCTAPNTATLPNCDCTPEPLPVANPADGSDGPPDGTMPTGWA
jgi:hypothetical protein